VKKFICFARSLCRAGLVLGFGALGVSGLLWAQSGAAYKAIYSGASASSAAGYSVNSLDSEIARTKTALSKQNITDKEKHDNYMLLGRLLKLSGDVEGAASAWMNAAYSERKNRDDNALLESAACYIAMGEWNKAEANVNIVLLTVKDNRALFQKARYLAAQIENFRDGNEFALQEMIRDPNYAAYQPSIYLTLWRLTKNANYKSKLLNLFPESPEAKILLSESAANGNNPGTVSEIPSNPALLAPTRVIVIETNAQANAQAASQTGKPPAGSAGSAGAAGGAAGAGRAAVGAAGTVSAAGARSIQVAILSGIDKGLAEAGALRDMGFKPELIRQNPTGSNSDFWVLLVPAGQDAAQTIKALRDLGYDPVPVH